MINCYGILGVSPAASREEIENAYQRLRQQYDPRKNSQNEEAKAKLEMVQQAFQILSNPVSKAKFDAFLKGGGKEMR